MSVNQLGAIFGVGDVLGGIGIALGAAAFLLWMAAAIPWAIGFSLGALAWTGILLLLHHFFELLRSMTLPIIVWALVGCGLLYAGCWLLLGLIL